MQIYVFQQIILFSRVTFKFYFALRTLIFLFKLNPMAFTFSSEVNQNYNTFPQDSNI